MIKIKNKIRKRIWKFSFSKMVEKFLKQTNTHREEDEVNNFMTFLVFYCIIITHKN